MTARAWKRAVPVGGKAVKSQKSALSSCALGGVSARAGLQSGEGGRLGCPTPPKEPRLSESAMRYRDNRMERDHAIVRNLMPDLDQAGPQGPAPLHRAQSPPAPLGNPHEVAMWQAEAQQPGGSAWCQEFGKLAWWVRFALLCTVGARVRHPDLTQVFTLRHLKDLQDVMDGEALRRWWASFSMADSAGELPAEPRLGACKDPEWERRCCQSRADERGLLHCSYLVWEAEMTTTAPPSFRLMEPREETIGNYVQRHPSLRRHGRLLRLKVRYSGEGASGSKEDARPGPEDERLLQALERRGMVLGQRLYRLLGLRPGDKRNDMKAAVSDLLGINFRAIENPGVFFRRIQLLFSPTLEVELRAQDGGRMLTIIESDDEYARDEDGRLVLSASGKPICMTDGNGLISANLVKSLPFIEGGAVAKDKKCRWTGWPLVWQVRIYSGPGLVMEQAMYKGTLTAVDDPDLLPPNTILLRRNSMRKVEPLVSVDDMMPECPPAPHASQHGPGSCSFSCSEFSLHVVRSFALRGDCRLNLQTIMLLGAGGVDAGLFEELVHAELEEVQCLTSDPEAAHQAAAKNVPVRQESLLVNLLQAGVPLEEPYVAAKLQQLQQKALLPMRNGSLPLPVSYRVVGVPDPTGTIPEGQVALVGLEGMCRTGQHCLLYRDPGIHPGDIRKVKVADSLANGALVGCLGRGQGALLFSTKGRRSLADCSAGGDFDGDEFLVCFHRPFVEAYRECEPRPETGDTDVSAFCHALASSHLSQGASFMQHYLGAHLQNDKAMKMAATQWQVLVDRPSGPHHRKCLRCVDLYYAALDADKAGMVVSFGREEQTTEMPKWWLRAGKRAGISSCSWTVTESTSVMARLNSALDAFLDGLKAEAMKETEADEAAVEAAKRLFHLDVPHALLEAWDERLHKEWKGEFARRLGPDGGDPGHDAPESGEEADHRGLEERGAFQEIAQSLRRKLLAGRSCHSAEVLQSASAAYQVCLLDAQRQRQTSGPGSSGSGSRQKARHQPVVPNAMAWAIASTELIQIMHDKDNAQRQLERPGAASVSQIAHRDVLYPADGGPTLLRRRQLRGAASHSWRA
eukprot:jgi/Tetstr1/461818/TSEL_006899.t1